MSTSKDGIETNTELKSVTPSPQASSEDGSAVVVNGVTFKHLSLKEAQERGIVETEVVHFIPAGSAKRPKQGN
ncbi:MAG: hypothetical protein RIC16_07870 [Rhodospirillales bacterium]